MSGPGITSEVDEIPGDPLEQQSRLKGAYPCMWGATWWSMIQHKGRRIYLGTFDTAEEAHQAYMTAKEKVRKA